MKKKNATHVIFYEQYALGWKLLSNSDYASARRHFEEAHYAGVFNIKTHALAHWGLFNTAIMQRGFYAGLPQLFFLLTAVFSPLMYLFFRTGLFLPIHPETKKMFDCEMALAKNSYRAKDFETALFHLGRAHILGNHFAFFHVRTHFFMLMIEAHGGHFRGMYIQALRTCGAFFTRMLVHRFDVRENPGHAEYPVGTRLSVDADVQYALNKSLGSLPN